MPIHTAMRSRSRLIATLLAVLSVVAGACATAGSVEASGEAAPPVVEAPGQPAPSVPTTVGALPTIEGTPVTLATVRVEPAPEDEMLVALEARWLCDVQRRAFSDLSDLDDARSALLANSDVDAADYEAFQVRLESEMELRMAVLTTFQADCTS